MDACKLNADPQCSTKKKIDSAQIKQYKRVKGNTFKGVCNTFLINWPIKQNHSFLRPFTAKWRYNEHCECFCIPLPLPTYCIEQHLPSQLLFFLLHCQYYFVHSCPIWINLVCFFRCPYSSTFLHTKQQCVCVYLFVCCTCCCCLCVVSGSFTRVLTGSDNRGSNNSSSSSRSISHSRSSVLLARGNSISVHTHTSVLFLLFSWPPPPPAILFRVLLCQTMPNSDTDRHKQTKQPQTAHLVAVLTLLAPNMCTTTCFVSIINYD